MQQLTLTEDRSVRWLEVPRPRLEGPGEALVRPIAVALCDLDQPAIRGEAPIPPPIALGHEAIAEVVEIGDAVAGVAVGERVIVPFQINCGECARCRAGATGSCNGEGVRPGSMYGFGVVGGDWGGALSDLLRVPFADAMLLPLPAGIEPATVASLPDNVVDGWRTVAPQLQRTPGAAVAVVGGGAPSIGLYAVQIATALGAERVAYFDVDPSRLAKAEQLGAEPISEHGAKPPERFPITVDASATREGLLWSLRSTEPEGICTSVGILYEQETPLPLLEMYTRGVTLRIGRVMARAAIPEALGLIAAGRLDPGLVTSNRVPWERAAEAVLEPETKLVVER